MLLDGRMLPARLPWHDGNELAEQIAQTVGVEVSELLGIHHVSNRPQDLIQQELQCLLLQVRDENRPSSFVRMILVDLEIYETNEVLPGAFRRFSKWLPLTLNRVSAFRLLELESLLHAHRENSRLWHNNILIPDGQVSPMHLADGDFLKVIIGHHEAFSECESEGSSFEIEDSRTEPDFVSSFQSLQYRPPSKHSPADVDPLSLKAVCISGDCRSHPYQQSVNSMNDPPNSSTGADNSPASAQSGRPPSADSPTWHHEIWDILCTAGATEMEEEGPIIYVNSYFISHLYTPRNEVLRPLRFDAEHESWDASVRFMWEDFVDQRAPFDIFVVHPDPPNTIYEGAVATVLVVQHPLPRKAAIVVTAVPDTHDVRHRKAVALSVDPLVPQTRLINAADVQDLCNRPGCVIWIGDREVQAGTDIRMHDGLGIRISIPADRLDLTQRSTDLIGVQQQREAAAVPNANEDNTDEVLLLSTQTMHLQQALRRTLRLLADDQKHDCRLEVSLSDQRIVQTTIEEDGRHLDGLQEAWFQASPVFAASADEAAVTFTTWFLHGEFWTRCESPRLLTLFPQRFEWDRQIRTLWRDRILPGRHFEVCVVHPESEQTSPRQVLVYQDLGHDERGILVSSFLHGGISRRHSQSAFVTPRQIAFNDLIRLANFQRECFDRSYLCVGFFGREPLEETRSLLPQHGAHFEVHIVDWDLVPSSSQQNSADSEVSSFMHVQSNWPTRAPTVCGVSLPEQPHESTPFQFQANAPVFIPGIPWDLHTHDEFVQDLFEAWNQVAVASDGEERSCRILTWFVDHQWPHPHGYAPR